MKSTAFGTIGQNLHRPRVLLVGLLFLLVLGCLALIVYWSAPHSVSTRQMAAVIRQAGHGKVRMVQNRTVNGIPAAQVRYPDHSLHTVFFLTHDGKIRGIVVGAHVYTDQGNPWNVIWPGIVIHPTHALMSIPNPADLPQKTQKAKKMQKTQKAIGTGLADGSPADGSLTDGSPAHAQAVLRYVAFARGFIWGRDDHTNLDALVDPNCLYCHQWFATEKAAVNAGNISFRIIPVAALKPSSVPRAIEIMSAKNPLSLWLQNENGFRTKTESGGIRIKKGIRKNKAVAKTVAVNTAILYAVDDHHPFTPTFIADRTGQTWMGANHNQELAHAFIR